MATFTNQATLTYKDTTITNSNIVTGEIVDVLAATKVAVMNDYVANDDVTYVISIVNSGNTSYSGIDISDDLGGYTFNGTTLYPLAYVAGSVRFYSNGALMTAPTVSAGPPLVISDITVPANGNVLIVYEANITPYAPLGSAGEVTNTATISGPGLAASLKPSTVIYTENIPQLGIYKSISPVPVAVNGEVTYTFVIQNYGNTEAIDTDKVFVSDTFDPKITNIDVKYNGLGWTDGVEYNYVPATGVFTSVEGEITVPAASYTQDPVDGNWIVAPGISTLVIKGRV